MVAVLVGKHMADSRAEKFPSGRSAVAIISVGRIFDLSLSGEYTVRAPRAVRPCGGREVRVRSNAVTI
jgi:hypothetical protein